MKYDREIGILNGVAEILGALAFLDEKSDIKIDDISNGLGLLGYTIHNICEDIENAEKAAEEEKEKKK